MISTTCLPNPRNTVGSGPTRRASIFDPDDGPSITCLSLYSSLGWSLSSTALNLRITGITSSKLFTRTINSP